MPPRRPAVSTDGGSDRSSARGGGRAASTARQSLLAARRRSRPGSLGATTSVDDPWVMLEVEGEKVRSTRRRLDRLDTPLGSRVPHLRPLPCTHDGSRKTCASTFFRRTLTCVGRPTGQCCVEQAGATR